VISLVDPTRGSIWAAVPFIKELRHCHCCLPVPAPVGATTGSMLEAANVNVPTSESTPAHLVALSDGMAKKLLLILVSASGARLCHCQCEPAARKGTRRRRSRPGRLLVSANSAS
jgi:hypothetical protein